MWEGLGSDWMTLKASSNPKSYLGTQHAMHGSGLGLMVGLRDPFLTSVTLQSYNSMSGMG